MIYCKQIPIPILDIDITKIKSLYTKGYHLFNERYHANPYWSRGVGRFPILNAIDQNFTQVLVIEVKNETEEIIAQFYGSHAKVNAHRFIESNIKYYKWINELAMEQRKEEA